MEYEVSVMVGENIYCPRREDEGRRDQVKRGTSNKWYDRSLHRQRQPSSKGPGRVEIPSGIPGPGRRSMLPRENDCNCGKEGRRHRQEQSGEGKLGEPTGRSTWPEHSTSVGMEHQRRKCASCL